MKLYGWTAQLSDAQLGSGMVRIRMTMLLLTRRLRRRKHSSLPSSAQWATGAEEQDARLGPRSMMHA